MPRWQSRFIAASAYGSPVLLFRSLDASGVGLSLPYGPDLRASTKLFGSTLLLFSRRESTGCAAPIVKGLHPDIVEGIDIGR